jgi:hypothetical protein
MIFKSLLIFKNQTRYLFDNLPIEQLPIITLKGNFIESTSNKPFNITTLQEAESIVIGATNSSEFNTAFERFRGKDSLRSNLLGNHTHLTIAGFELQLMQNIRECSDQEGYLDHYEHFGFKYHIGKRNGNYYITPDNVNLNGDYAFANNWYAISQDGSLPRTNGLLYGSMLIKVRQQIIKNNTR